GDRAVQGRQRRAVQQDAQGALVAAGIAGTVVNREGPLRMPTALVNAIVIGLGGALGALARCAVTGPILGKLGHRFPWGVLLVNLVGCFFIGLVMYMYLYRGETDDRLRFFLVAGFLGSLTTFSTFGFDTFELVRDGYPG